MNFANDAMGHLVCKGSTHSSYLPAEGIFSWPTEWTDWGTLHDEIRRAYENYEKTSCHSSRSRRTFRSGLDNLKAWAKVSKLERWSRPRLRTTRAFATHYFLDSHSKKRKLVEQFDFNGL
jgi:hypothetical protein